MRQGECCLAMPCVLPTGLCGNGCERPVHPEPQAWGWAFLCRDVIYCVAYHVHAVLATVDPAPLASDDLITLLVKPSVYVPSEYIAQTDQMVLCPARPPSFHNPPAVSSHLIPSSLHSPAIELLQ